MFVETGSDPSTVGMHTEGVLVESKENLSESSQVIPDYDIEHLSLSLAIKLTHGEPVDLSRWSKDWELP